MIFENIDVPTIKYEENLAQKISAYKHYVKIASMKKLNGRYFARIDRVGGFYGMSGISVRKNDNVDKFDMKFYLVEPGKIFRYDDTSEAELRLSINEKSIYFNSTSEYYVNAGTKTNEERDFFENTALYIETSYPIDQIISYWN